MPLVAARDSRLRPHVPSHRPWHPIPVLAGMLLALALCLGGGRAQAQGTATDSTIQVPPAPAPPTGVTAADVPNDKGEVLAVSWKASSD